MRRGLLVLFGLALAALAAFFVFSREAREIALSELARRVPSMRSALEVQREPIAARLQKRGFALGQPVLIRIFKEESQLEIWVKRDEVFEHFQTHDICKWSGALGPKLKEGDGQSPEGFYFASANQLLPTSKYHRAINTGYPNAFDQSLGRTGSVLMIHGSCVSIGCYAMTDPVIYDIYNIVEAAINQSGAPVPIHLFPFRMTPENLARNANSPWSAFWNNLAEGDQIFARTKLPPKTFACAGRYRFETGGSGCTQISAW
jgi:murein L,D-transpeptidase YafK